MIKTGVDIVNIERVSQLGDLSLLLHPQEMKNNDQQHLAGIIALKEACIKAFEMKPSWYDFEISKNKNGKPRINFSREIKSKIKSYDCSIAHDGKYAVAIVVIEMSS